MKKQIIATVLIASVAACGALLQLRDGQIQAWQKDGSWKCVDQEIRDIVNREPGDFALTGTAALESMALTDPNVELLIRPSSGYYFEGYNPHLMEVSDDFIRELCQSGRVCEVMGHQWQDYTYMNLDYRPDVVADQRCGLCGKTRVQTVQWKEE